MRNTKRRLLLLALCVAIPAGSTWAGVVGLTNPADFSDTVDWCQFGCHSSQLTGPQSWVSALGDIGYVYGANDPYLDNFVQGDSWPGNFDPGMGLLYNNACCGSAPGPSDITFLQAETGVGVYIESNFNGAFTATISLFDSNNMPLGSYTTRGIAENTPGTALFIGANSADPVWFAQFSAIGSGPDEPDFAIGAMLLNGTGETGEDSSTQREDEIPEPASILLMAPALFGLVAFTRRRASDHSR